MILYQHSRRHTLFPAQMDAAGKGSYYHIRRDLHNSNIDLLEMLDGVQVRQYISARDSGLR